MKLGIVAAVKKYGDGVYRHSRDWCPSISAATGGACIGFEGTYLADARDGWVIHRHLCGFDLLPTDNRAAERRARLQDRLEEIRSFVLIGINDLQPYTVSEAVLSYALAHVGLKCSEIELRRELCLLESKGLIHLNRLEGAPSWTCRSAAVVDITRSVH